MHAVDTAVIYFAERIRHVRQSNMVYMYNMYSEIVGRDLHKQNILKYNMLTLLKARSSSSTARM